MVSSNQLECIYAKNKACGNAPPSIRSAVYGHAEILLVIGSRYQSPASDEDGCSPDTNVYSNRFENCVTTERFKEQKQNAGRIVSQDFDGTE